MSYKDRMLAFVWVDMVPPFLGPYSYVYVSKRNSDV